MVYQEIRLGETKVRFLVRWLGIALLLWLVTFALPGFTQELRVEATAGQCTHRLAEDTNWHYELGGYETNMGLKPNCWNLSGVWMMDKTFGWKAGVVDLGSVRANNTYPLPEQAYFDAKNNHTAIDATTYRFQGNGHSRGFTFGPVFEAKHKDFAVRSEAGVAVLYNTWHAWTAAAGTWDYADSWNSTWYVGGSVRYKYLMAGVTLFRNVHASNANLNPLFIRPTTGPVVQTTVGVSIPL